ncbi:hypothetical protein [Schlesneria sp.]|uniref:hypothetical protein n=1 Tax=Schlesneria sp. TaxID=2762018 RepID=UPI002F00A696
MSVKLLSADELGLFAAIATHRKLLSFRDALATAELISLSNCAAFNEQYNELERALSMDEIEPEALSRLARQNFTSDHFGPIVYNCLTNDGVFYLGELEADSYAEGALQVASIKELCDAVENWQSAEMRRIARQAEDDESFAEVGPLPKLSAAELQAKMDELGATRIITAQFRIDQSDSQSDYFGCRTSREVVIGFGTGKRDSFKQLRTAAAAFPPTAEFGPGLDVWHVRLQREEQTERNPYPAWKRIDERFTTEEQAAEWVRSALERDNQKRQASEAFCPEIPFGYELECESIEHRENYSMGGGNYLGFSRYSGWMVRSTQYLPESIEYFEAPAKAKAKPQRKTQTPTEIPKPTLGDLYSANV